MCTVHRYRYNYDSLSAVVDSRLIHVPALPAQALSTFLAHSKQGCLRRFAKRQFLQDALSYAAVHSSRLAACFAAHDGCSGI